MNCLAFSSACKNRVSLCITGSGQAIRVAPNGPIYDGSLVGGLITAKVDLANPRIAHDSTRIYGETDGIHLEIEFSNLYMDATADATVLGAAVFETATITADKATLATRLRLALDANNQLVAVLEGTG